MAIAPGEVPWAPQASDGDGPSVPGSLRAGQVLLLAEGVLWLGAAAWTVWRSATGLGSVNSFFSQCQQQHCGGMAALALVPIGMADIFLGAMLVVGVLSAVVANVGLGCGMALARRVRAARVIAIVIASLGALVDISLVRYVPPAASSRDWLAAIEAVWAPPRIPVVLLGATTLLANLALIYLLGFASGTTAAFLRPPPSAGAWAYPYPRRPQHRLRRVSHATTRPKPRWDRPTGLSQEEWERLEATVGIEPTIRVLQTRALPLGYVAAPARIPEPARAGPRVIAVVTARRLLSGSRSTGRLGRGIGLRRQHETDLEGIGERP